MPIEIAPYINSLNPVNPTANDPKSQGDDHIRLVKGALRATFPGVTEPITATAAQINKAAGSNWVYLGGGVGQMNNVVRIGWTGSALALQVDNSNFAATWPIGVTGSAGTARAATAGYFTAAATVPLIELHKPGIIAGAWHINSANRLAFVQTIGDGMPRSERMTLDIENGNMVIQGTLTQASDERLKTDWRPLASDFVDRLAGVKSGTYSRLDTGQMQVGVAAQSLRGLMPEAVQENPRDGHLSVAYGNAALAACIELAREVKRLRADVAALQAAQ